jgi:hypothetical protein
MGLFLFERYCFYGNVTVKALVREGTNLDTPQRYPRAGSQSYPSPAAEPNAEGSTTVYFGPAQPAGVKRRPHD